MTRGGGVDRGRLVPGRKAGIDRAAQALWGGGAPRHRSVVGYLLGGGIGLLGRRTGYASDYVRAIDIVTADGVLRHVTAASDALSWALRGGGGTFGAVTAVETALVPVTRLYGGGLHFAADTPPTCATPTQRQRSPLPALPTFSCDAPQRGFRWSTRR